MKTLLKRCLVYVKDIIKFVVYSIVDLFIKPSKEIIPRSLLLVRLDAIGDYVLFRNFIEILRTSERYKDYKITLLGNIIWKELSQEIDGELIDEFIFVDRNKFLKNLFYRYRKLKEITSKGYEVLIHPTYSRDFFCSDMIVRAITAKEKIGSIGDLSNIKGWQKRISDKYYTKLIDAKPGILFEFYRNKEFFERLLGIPLEIKRPSIKLKPKKLPFELPTKYAVLFIGGGAGYRKWKIEGFVEIGRFLQKLGYKIVLCGSLQDIADALRFRRLFGEDYFDFVGKTSLVELMYIISNAELMVSNETVAPHLAVALGKPNKVFVISNGNHFGRFTPYPKELTSHYYPIYHPKIEMNLDDFDMLVKNYGSGSRLDINEIGFELVKNKIEAHVCPKIDCKKEVSMG